MYFANQCPDEPVWKFPTTVLMQSMHERQMKNIYGFMEQKYCDAENIYSSWDTELNYDWIVKYLRSENWTIINLHCAGYLNCERMLKEILKHNAIKVQNIYKEIFLIPKCEKELLRNRNGTVQLQNIITVLIENQYYCSFAEPIFDLANVQPRNTLYETAWMYIESAGNDNCILKSMLSRGS